MKSTALVTILNGNAPFFIFFVTLAIGLVVAIFLYLADNYSLLYYGDAISHLIGARKMVDWMDPGIHQLGTVWLPLPHFLLLPFSLVDSFFTSGFAGLAISLPLHALTSVLIYKIVKEHVGNSNVGIIGAFLYAVNPSLIYLGITAMTEAPFMLFFVAFAYYLQKWINDGASSIELSNSKEKSLICNYKIKYLLLASIFISLATLCRYEAWILVLVFVPYIFVSVLRKQVTPQYKILVILISLISFTGISVWLGWNASVYGDPLEFANAEFYAASSQALERTTRDNLFLQPLNVIAIYGMNVAALYGPVLLVFTLLGYVNHFKEKSKRKKRTVFYAFLSIIPLFTIITLVIGIGEMNQWWFNSRFAAFIAPLVILLTSSFIANTVLQTKKKYYVIVIIVLFAVYGSIPALGAVTFLDAKGGYIYEWNPSAFETGEFLKSEYADGNIMIMTGSMQAHKIMISSGIHLKQFDDIIESQTWKRSFKEPWLYDKWIIIGKEPDSDSIVPAKYWEERMDALKTYYNVEFENQYYTILLRK